MKKTGANNSTAVSCDIYAIDDAYLPTGASLGTVVGSIVSSSTYAEYTFTFASAITVTDEKAYCFVLSCGSADGIDIYYSNPVYSGTQIRYTTA